MVDSFEARTVIWANIRAQLSEPSGDRLREYINLQSRLEGVLAAVPEDQPWRVATVEDTDGSRRPALVRDDLPLVVMATGSTDQQGAGRFQIFDPGVRLSIGPSFARAMPALDASVQASRLLTGRSLLEHRLDHPAQAAELQLKATSWIEALFPNTRQNPPNVQLSSPPAPTEKIMGDRDFQNSSPMPGNAPTSPPAPEQEPAAEPIEHQKEVQEDPSLLPVSIDPEQTSEPPAQCAPDGGDDSSNDGSDDGQAKVPEVQDRSAAFKELPVSRGEGRNISGGRDEWAPSSVGLSDVLHAIRDNSPRASVFDAKTHATERTQETAVQKLVPPPTETLVIPPHSPVLPEPTSTSAPKPAPALSNSPISPPMPPSEPVQAPSSSGTQDAAPASVFEVTVDANTTYLFVKTILDGKARVAVACTDAKGGRRAVCSARALPEALKAAATDWAEISEIMASIDAASGIARPNISVQAAQEHLTSRLIAAMHGTAAPKIKTAPAPAQVQAHAPTMPTAQTRAVPPAPGSSPSLNSPSVTAPNPPRVSRCNDGF